MNLSMPILITLLAANVIPLFFRNRALAAYKLLSALILVLYVLFMFQSSFIKIFAKTETVTIGRHINIDNPSLTEVVELAQSQGLPIAGLTKGGLLSQDRLHTKHLTNFKYASSQSTLNVDEKKKVFYVWSINFEIIRIESKHGVWTITQRKQRQGLHLHEVHAFTKPMHFQSKFINE